MPPDSRCTLGLFAKWPEPGRVKTRLAAATAPAFAAAIATAFLADSLDRLTPFYVRRVLSYAPSERFAEFSALAADRWELEPQCDGDLGRRMADFFAARFREGATRVVLLGTDSPTVPTEFIDRAFAALADADIVLGPATDGGYYLIGGCPGLPDLFTGISWSGPAVLADTIARLPSTAKFALLPPWYDVDTADDWWVLCGHLAALRRAGTDPLAPRTEALASVHAP